MKVNPNDPAMPHRNHDRVSGMSIRTELAARAMQGLIAGTLSNPKIKIGKPGELERSIADDLVKALEYSYSYYQLLSFGNKKLKTG